MHDALGVQMIDRPGDDAHQPHDGVEGEPLPRDPLGQAFAFDVFHREVVLAVVLADVVDLRDVGMPQAGGGPGLDLEAADVFRRRQVRGQDHLDGHGAVEGLLPRLVDHAHAAPADFFQELVGAEVAGQVCFESRQIEVGRRCPRPAPGLPGPPGTSARRQLRMFAEQCLAIRPLARLKLRQVVVEQFEQYGVFGRFIFHSFIPDPSSPIASCSFLIARIQSICTAGRERSMRSATSLNGSR